MSLQAAPGAIHKDLYRMGLASIAGVVLLALYRVGGRFGYIGLAAEHFMLLYIFTWITCICFVLLLPADGAFLKTGLAIVFLSILCRIMLIGHPASDDMNRYLWEGKLIRAGQSPYSAPASDPRFQRFHDACYDAMNHKDARTAYPPLAELLFAAIGAVRYRPFAFKTIFVLCDLATVVILLRMLTHRAQQARWAAVYALNPLTLYAFAGQAHFDSMMVCLLMAAILLHEKGKSASSLFLLGLSFQIKIVSIILLPILLRRGRWRQGWAFLIGAITPSLYFAEEGFHFLAGAFDFGTDLAYNAPVHALFRWMTGSITMASYICAFLLCTVCIWICLRVRDVRDACLLAVGSMLIFLPTIHFWYLSWVLPLATLCLSLPWVLLSLTIAGYFTALGRMHYTGQWDQPVWACLLQWLPFFLLLLKSLPASYRRIRYLYKQNIRPPQSVSVVVPTYNEVDHLRDCIQSIRASSHPAAEILVVDGGSTDGTREKARALRATVLEAPLGRGAQIRSGIAHVKSDVVLILHADARMQAHIIGAILRILTRNPHVAAGAVGQRFAPPGPTLKCIELLNDLRAGCFGVSFGDQGQFFVKKVLDDMGGFPDLPLMEDVEVMLRLKNYGRVCYLWGGLVTSSRRWTQEGFLRRFARIIHLLIHYRTRRMFGKISTDDLYAIYYGRPDGGNPANHISQA